MSALPDSTSDSDSDAEFVDEFRALAERVAALRGEERIAAACRGSANPAALQWLSESLALSPVDGVIDLGAGLGGPAAWLRATSGCRMIASDPSPAAVAGARRLFELAAVQASATACPFRDGAFDVALLLGVLPVVDDVVAVVREARRVARLVGVLDFCSVTGATVHAGGSRFEPVDKTADQLRHAWTHVDLRRIDSPTPDTWKRAAQRAQSGVPEPASEREVVAAIESGQLALHALVGR